MKISRCLLAAVILGSVFSITYCKVIKILKLSGQYFAWSYLSIVAVTKALNNTLKRFF
ncbi:hypothetical protein SAMN05192538_3198 [Bacillus velezensis]|nr:hypothetical protein KOF112_04660 [Bacillus velezensis]SDK28269.1 hypothetical protein SAMN05192538_3198 [Bacillus velezensis]